MPTQGSIVHCKYEIKNFDDTTGTAIDKNINLLMLKS